MDADVAGGVICIVMGLFFFLIRGWLARQMIDFQRSNWGLNVLDERHVEELKSVIRFNAVIFVLFGIYLIIEPYLPHLPVFWWTVAQIMQGIQAAFRGG